MPNQYVQITPSGALHGSVSLSGAKNAVLVTMASLILTSGKSRLKNVPCSDDVKHYITLLKDLGAQVFFDESTGILEVDTSTLHTFTVGPSIMDKMRASILVMGPLLARFGRAEIALPGGCLLGARPIDFHLKAFQKMGACIDLQGKFLSASTTTLRPVGFVLEYPSVGATENIIMAATLTPGTTQIINAAIEPEVLDLITVLKKMGANIEITVPATITIEGVSKLEPIEHEIMPDRLEAGSLLLAAAITKGSITLSEARADTLDVFLEKLKDMGHQIIIGPGKKGVTLIATDSPQAVSFRTAPYPGFPTDLQAPMLVAQCLAAGTSTIQETVFENRLMHVRELQKMGAQISLRGDTAIVKGVEQFYGTQVIASDIRAGCALVLAGLIAEGKTFVAGIHHLKRGYQELDRKLATLGATIEIIEGEVPTLPSSLIRGVDRTSDQIR